MTERHGLTIKEPSDTHEDWSTLIARAADNVSRIVQSEIYLFENRFRSALEGQIYYALAGLAMVAVMICGVLCALAALVVYAHQWVQWWEAFAIGAFIMLAVAGVMGVTVCAAPSKMPRTSGPESETAGFGQSTTSELGKPR
ncbi:MAG TPA: phage holin family protein [Candidatus Binataceae bacterium]|nr:phage holin family protein [Candidatus Binataceae bacterium]